MSDRARVLAPAKVNLVLHVLHRRPDGYHEIDTLFQAIDLSDEVEVELVDGDVALEVESAEHLGPEEDNLAYRAAARLLQEVAPSTGARVRLRKRIPAGGGLGGGSSDAAAVLRCIAELIGDCEPARLEGLAVDLGSDVPFFLGESPLARGRGRGELLEPLGPLPPRPLVLVSPRVHVSTAGAYATLAEVRAGQVGPSEGLAGPAPSTWRDVESLVHNDFEPVISAAHPEIRRALYALRDYGASVSLMSGSGSSCFGLFQDADVARWVAEELRARHEWTCAVVQTLAKLPPVVVG
jgi:4-diphosphocytidyl-2-C-methyl-D-erythritol kinase